MKKIFAAATTLVVFLTTVVFAPGASAELSDLPQTSWGVQGLIFGTQTDEIEAEVFAMESANNAMFVGGRFTELTDGVQVISQAALAAFDASTGVPITTFNPVLDGAVYALASSADGTRLFVGGDFTTVNGVATGGLVALDTTTGAIDAGWSGRIGGYNVVRAIEVAGPWIYVGGGFTSISSASGGNAANRVARFSTSAGLQDASWRPNVSGGTVWGVAASSDMDRVYVVGSFLSANGVATPGGFVAIEASTQNNATGVQAFPTNTQNVSAQYNFDVIAVNGLVFVAGSQHYLQVLNESDLSLNVFHLSSDRGDYQSLTLAGDRVYAGCHCYGGTTLESANGILWVGPRPDGVDDAPVFHTATNAWMTAFDANTGLHIDGSTPAIATSGEGVWAIEQAPDGCIWSGGSVTGVGGTDQYGFTRLCDTAQIDLERPSSPTAFVGVAVGAGVADFTWNASTDNFAVAGYYIYDSANDTIVGQSAAESAQVSGLLATQDTFYVKAFDAAGNISWRSNLYTIDLVDTDRPSQPSALMATVTLPADISLSWTAATDNFGVVGYYVYDDDTDTQILDVTATTANVAPLPFGTHRFYIKAYDAAGNISWRSNTTTVELINPALDTQRPSVPSSIAVTSTAPLTLDVAWGLATDNVAVAGYRVFDSTTNIVIADVAASPLSLTNVAPGVYSYYVKAYDAAGNQSWRTGVKTITIEDPATETQRPTQPSNLVGTVPANGVIDLTWTASTDNVGVAGYRVHDNLTGDVLLDVPGTTATLDTLSFGYHRFYIKAYDAAGNTSWRSNTIAITLVDANSDTQRPSSPTGLMEPIVGAGTVDLTWNASTDNVGVAGYRVFDSATNTVIADVATTSTQLTGVAPGTYSYYIKAYDAAGNQSWRSNVESATMP